MAEKQWDDKERLMAIQHRAKRALDRYDNKPDPAHLYHALDDIFALTFYEAAMLNLERERFSRSGAGE
jgi:hypothetical protein